MNDMLISVCLITYNHSSFIEQALDSVLMQHHPYAWEVIVADDNSTDGTKEIILEYARRYPLLVKPIVRNANVGAYKNWIELLSAAKGKYTAYLEGDDFWTDRNKLLDQTRFMENNPAYSGCFHNSEERFEQDDTQASFLYCNFKGGRDITFADLSYANLIPSCSMFFKTELSHKIPSWVGKLKMGDWPFHLMNSSFGNYRYLPRVMGVHRIHKASTWMSQDPQKNKQHVIDAYEIMITESSYNAEFKDQLIVAKAKYQIVHKPTLIRRGINLLRRLKNSWKGNSHFF